MNSKRPDPRLPWYTFVPVLGYFLYLPRSRKDFPDVRKAAYLFFILENTLLYILIGLIGGVMRIPPLVWFLMVPTIIVASTSVEFFAIRRWGDRFRMFGWHNIQKFGNTRFTLSAVYVALQTFSFLTLGYATSWLMYR